MKQTVRTDDGVDIEYEVYGLGPLTLFFQHGWGNAADFWDHIFNEHLDLTGLRCIAASYRGHGGSDKAVSGYTHDRFARDMFAVADAAGADRFSWSGSAWPASFAVIWHTSNQSRVGPSVDRTSWSGTAGRAPGGVCALAGSRARSAAIPSDLESVHHATCPRGLLARYCASVASASRVALEGTIDMFYESIVDEVSGVRVPTLVIAGAGDPILTPDYVRRFVVESIPGARLITLPCGHEVPIEMPKETGSCKRSWLAYRSVLPRQERLSRSNASRPIAPEKQVLGRWRRLTYSPQLVEDRFCQHFAIAPE